MCESQFWYADAERSQVRYFLDHSRGGVSDATGQLFSLSLAVVLRLGLAIRGVL